MNTKFLCIDSDIFAILAAAKRLERVIDLLNFKMDEVRRLPALDHMLRHPKSFSEFSLQQKQVALEMALKIKPLEESPNNSENRQKLVKINIDAGEQVLYALVAEQPMTWLASGDIKSMKALADPDLCEIKKMISSRIVCFEASIYLLIKMDGYRSTADAFSSMRQKNAKVRSIFPEKEPLEANQMDGIVSYLRSLCSELGRGFLFCPPCPKSHEGDCNLSEPPPF